MRLYGKLIEDGSDWLFWPATRLDYRRPAYWELPVVISKTACRAECRRRDFDVIEINGDTAAKLGLGREPVRPDAAVFSFL
jgi:hypothetical protein